MEEAHVWGRSPTRAAGAWFIESLTDQLARAGWAAFQAIEAAGGIVRALEGGHFKSGQTDEASVVGVSVFPNANDEPPLVETVSASAVDAPSPRLPGPDSHCTPVVP